MISNVSANPPRQRIDTWSATHVGLVRDGNEDFHRPTPARGIFLVADGIGGHPGGEFASSIAVEAAHASLINSNEMPAPAMRRAFAHANQCVLDAAEKNQKLWRMGTTLVAAMVMRGEIIIAHCGDSRAYLFRQGCLILLTEDHGFNGVLHSCVGDERGARVSIRNIATMSGDRLLLCTDGLSSYVEERVIAHCLRENKEPKPCVNALIKETLRAGAPDNVTVTVVRIRERA